MATGDNNDIVRRLKRCLPVRWFGDSSPNLDALLGGVATVVSGVYDLVTYTRKQTRISTASDGWLDVIAADFYGTTLVRRVNQADEDFRANILANLFRTRNTRESIQRSMLTATGREPIIFEPARPMDTGAYDSGSLAYDEAGGYGEVLSAQAFVTAYRPIGGGIPLVAGYDTPSGGYGEGRAEYIDGTMYDGVAPDDEIFSAIEAVRPAGVTIWVQIVDAPLSDVVVVRTGPRVTNILGKIIVATRNGY